MQKGTLLFNHSTLGEICIQKDCQTALELAELPRVNKDKNSVYQQKLSIIEEKIAKLYVACYGHYRPVSKTNASKEKVMTQPLTGTQLQQAEKLYIFLRTFLSARKMFKALKAFELAKSVHLGTRKDGVTPEFQHQMEIAAHFLLQESLLPDLEDILILTFLHDLLEDHPTAMVHNTQMAVKQTVQIYIQETFGDTVYFELTLLDKNRWSSKDAAVEQLSNYLRPALVKLGDRRHNFQSMYRGSFSLEKQETYADAVEYIFLPMAKQARKNFPEFSAIFRLYASELKNQLELVRLLIEKQHVIAGTK